VESQLRGIMVSAEARGGGHGNLGGISLRGRDSGWLGNPGGRGSSGWLGNPGWLRGSSGWTRDMPHHASTMNTSSASAPPTPTPIHSRLIRLMTGFSLFTLLRTITMRTYRRERVIGPGKLQGLCVQGFAYPFTSDKFPQISGTGSSDGRTEAKRDSTRPFSCKSASAEGQNGNTDLTPVAYRVTSQLPFRRSIGDLSFCGSGPDATPL
jgi:hypothetical protein